jgi:hypothetical protein
MRCSGSGTYLAWRLTAALGAQPSLGLGGYLQTLTAPARFLCSLLGPFYMRIRDDGALGALADADGAEGSQD